MELVQRENQLLREQRKEAVDQLDTYLLISEQAPLFKIDHKPGKSDSLTVPVFMWSDWHCEEEVKPESVRSKNEFNLDVADRRISRLIDKSVVYAKSRETETDIPEAVVWLGGDFISGYIHEELMPSNQLSPPEAILWVKARIKAGIIHIAQNFPKVRVVCNVGNHGRCHDAETELLTAEGWKTYDQLEVGEMVATYNKETGETEWQPLQDVYVDTYSGPMKRVKNRTQDFLVTPKHRMLTMTAVGKNATLEELESIQTRGARGRVIPRAARGHDLELEDVSDDELRMLGWIMTDGHLRKSSGNGRTTVTIYQSKPAGRAKIEALLGRLGLAHSVAERERDITEVYKRQLVKPPLPQGVYSLTTDSSERFVKLLEEDKKNLPSWIHELSQRQVGVLLEALMDGDGSSGPGEYVGELHGTESFLNQVQALLVVNGRSSRLRVDTRGNHVLSIHSGKKTYLSYLLEAVEDEFYEGVIWCGTVENGTLITRRNGCLLISGNTTKKRWVHNAQRNSYEYLMYHVLASELKEGGYHNVEFFIPESYFAECEILGFKCRFHHGDSVRYNGGVGGPSIPVNKAVADWNIGEAVDFDYFGHFHFAMDHGYWLCNGSLVGYNQFSVEIKARFQRPLQAIDMVHHRVGRTDLIKVYCD